MNRSFQRGSARLAALLCGANLVAADSPAGIQPAGADAEPPKVSFDSPPADIVPYAGLSPQDACDKASLPPGFKMHVFAGEPDVKQPIAFCLDDRGRAWVAEGYTYPRRQGNPPTRIAPAPGRTPALENVGVPPTPEQLQDIFGGADRILVFEDSDGDHHFDKRTVFLENLNLVSGLEIGFGGVWIGAAPYLMFVPVADWDQPKPAGDPQILLDGWNYTADTHEVLNTFTWGPDGWLYGCHGVFCPSHVGRPGAPESARQWMDAGVWRYHPTRHIFEVFTEGGSNPWGIDFDDSGQLFAEMCVIPHFWHMIQGARIERQGGEHFCINRDETARNGQYRDQRSHKPVFPFVYEDIQQHGDHVHWAGNKGPHAANARSDAVGGGHAHAGMMCYLGGSWPDEYRGRLLIGNIHGQRRNMDIPERRGSGYVGHHGKDFLNFNDTWSQTLNQLYDQDGSVYIIDWYDRNQCHHTRQDGHDRTNGRIYKIVYGDTQWTRVDLAKKTDLDLFPYLLHPNDWYGRHARRILQERAQHGKIDRKVIQHLRAFLHLDKASLRYGWPTSARPLVEEGSQLRLLWAYHCIAGLVEKDALGLLRHEQDDVRAWTIQLSLQDMKPTPGLLREFARLARQEKSPVVRLYLASALQRLKPDERWDILTALLAHAEDAGDHNLPLMYWYAAEACVASDPAKAVALLKQCRIPVVREFIARRLATTSLQMAASN